MSDSATDTPRPGTHHPHLARERALKVLFAADVRGVDPRLLLDEVATRPDDLELLDELEPDQEQVAGDEDLQQELTRRRRVPVDDYTRDLVAGVAARRPAIDELLGDVADRWPVHRMPAVDRNLLRLAVYELAEQDTPPAVVIDEAVALAIAFAGEKARGFVNGVLETVRQRVVAGEVALTVTPRPEPPSDDVASDEPADATAPAPAAEAATVDVAAQEAYDVALDLLGDDAAPETEADAAAADESDEPDEPDESDEPDQAGAEDPVRDEDAPLW